MIIIIIDTNIIYDDPYLANPTFDLLFDALRRTEHSLCIPEVVIDEAVNNRCKELEKSLKKTLNDLRQLEQHTGQEFITPPMSDDDFLSKLEDSYRSLLRKKFDAVQACY